MKLTSKTAAVSTEKKVEPVDWTIMEIDYTAAIPYGKYQGWTLQEVKQQDKSYYEWMCKESMIEKWTLYRIKGSAMRVRRTKAQWNPIVWHDGSTVLGIRECPWEEPPIDPEEI